MGQVPPLDESSGTVTMTKATQVPPSANMPSTAINDRKFAELYPTPPDFSLLATQDAEFAKVYA